MIILCIEKVISKVFRTEGGSAGIYILCSKACAIFFKKRLGFLKGVRLVPMAYTLISALRLDTQLWGHSRVHDSFFLERW